jgi:hypothetical protein
MFLLYQEVLQRQWEAIKQQTGLFVITAFMRSLSRLR